MSKQFPKIVIIFNGPAGSGKDELVTELKKRLYGVINVKHLEFKKVIYQEAAQRQGMDLNKFIALCTNRDTKEVVTDKLTINGKPASPRQALIHTSEDIIKPLFGSEYFGCRLAEQTAQGINLVSDGGFVEEIVPVAKECGQENVHIVRLLRPDYTFDGDSRKYICRSHLWEHGLEDVSITPLRNNGTLEEFHSKGLDIVIDILLEAIRGYRR